MSLLFNLLNYSTLSFRQSAILSPKEEERSRSTLNFKDNELINQNKTAPKSLQKISSLHADVKIDPKARMFHRLGHLISKKCRKHYYTLFVTLQTIKKKNLYLQPDGEWDHVQPQAPSATSLNLYDKMLLFNNKQNKLTLSQLKPVISKIQQIQRLYLTKLFENTIKGQFFNFLRINTLLKQKIIVFELKLSSFKERAYKKNAIKKLQMYSHYVFKVQLLTSFINELIKKYQTKINSKKVALKESFEQIISNSLSVPNVNKHVQPIQPPNCIDLTPIKTSEFQLDNTQTIKKAFTFNNMIDLPETYLSTRPANKLSFFEHLASKVQTLSLQANNQSIAWHLYITTDLNQQPFISCNTFSRQQKNLICTKHPSNKLQSDLPDQRNYQDYSFIDDENIFIENKIKSFSRINRFKQSRVISLKNNRIQRNCWKNINTEIKNNQLNKFEGIDVSQVSANSIQKSQKSINTLIYECNKLNFSAFGGQAVNFKNSLVRERELTQQNQKIFQTKILQKDINEILFNNNYQPEKPISFKKLHNRNVEEGSVISNSGYMTRHPSFQKNPMNILNYSCYEDASLISYQQTITPTRDNFTGHMGGKQSNQAFFRNKSEEGIKRFAVATIGDQKNKPKSFIRLMKTKLN